MPLNHTTTELMRQSNELHEMILNDVAAAESGLNINDYYAKLREGPYHPGAIRSSLFQAIHHGEVRILRGNVLQPVETS